MAVRFVLTITPADVGVRVTTRWKTPAGSREAVGVLESWADGTLAVRKRDGTLVLIPEETLVGGKAVPPRPVRGQR